MNGQDEMTREFTTRLVAREGSNTDVSDEYGTYMPPLHVLSYQAHDDERQ